MQGRNQERRMVRCGGSKSDPDHYNNFVTPKKKRIRIHAFQLPQNATYNPVNRSRKCGKTRIPKAFGIGVVRGAP